MKHRAAWGRLALFGLGAVAVFLLVQFGTPSRDRTLTLAAAPALSPEEAQLLGRAEDMSRAYALVVKMVRPAVASIHVERVQVVTRREVPMRFGNEEIGRAHV